MMHAFVERLRCGDHLIVRAGPLAKAYGDPYERACVGEIDGKAVTLMAFESPLGTFPMAVFRAAVRALKSDGFKQVHLDRLTANPRRLVFTQGDEEGKITMTKALHENHGSKHADGTFKTDHATVSPIIAAYVAKLASGAFKIQGMSEIALGNGLFARTFVIQE